MEKIKNNGYDYVNLDLPSGTLWSTCNVGADKPIDYGLYFQWGDTQGYTKEQVGKDKPFNFANYKLSINGSFTNFSKYTTPGTMIELEDDAANVNMGGNWHIPTPEQIRELIDNTIATWKTLDDGISGKLFTSKKDKSKSIFIPAAGYVWKDFSGECGKDGFLWSSMLDPNYVYSSKNLGFNSKGSYLCAYNRDFGFSIRGVIG